MGTDYADLNPFVYARPLTPSEAIERRDAVAHLLALAEGAHNATLFAPRRYGKTSLLKQLAETAEREADMLVVAVDFSDVLSEADVAARIESSYRALQGPVARFVAEHLQSVGIGTPAGGVVLQRAARPEPIAVIHELLELPVKIHEREGRRVLVIYDEFQALIALEGMDGVFRSHLQHHGETASYIFSGSEPSLLRALFEDRARPLYGQAEPSRLARLPDEDTGDFVAARFAQTGRGIDTSALWPLVSAAGGHPQRLMLLAHRLWALTGLQQTADLALLRSAYEAAMRQVDAEMRGLWESLNPNERRVLLGVAAGLSPTQSETVALTGLRSRSSAQRATQVLVGKGVLEREGDEGFRIVDPLLERWTRRRPGARPIAYVLPLGPGWVVTDGPSLVFEHSRHDTLDAAQRAADQIVSGRAGGDVIVYDTADPNDLPEWAV
jgi:uncharacterized protein